MQKKFSISTRIIFAYNFLAVCTLFSVEKIIAQNRDYPIQPVTFNRVHVHDDFWAPRIAINVDITIPYVLQKCRETGRVDNFFY